MKRFCLLLLITLATCVLVALSLSPTAVAQEGKTVVLTLSGKIYRANATPLPLPVGERSYLGYFERLWGYGQDLTRCLDALSPRLGEGVAHLIDSLETPPQDATVEVTPTGVKLNADVKGWGFDRYRLGKAVAVCLDGGAPAPIQLVETRATVTLTDLKRQTQTIGRFTTLYDQGNRNRCRNLQLACKALSGVVLASGETLSFNQKVGERTENRGFLPAPVVQDGAYIQGVGGGVCQVSTTLYNAALRAGLDVVESHPHTLTAHYVKAGWDAMVSGWSDLVLSNPSPYPVYIFAFAQGGQLTVKLLGLPQGKVKLWAGEPTVTPSCDLDEKGERLISTEGYELVKKGQDGIRIETYREIDGIKQRLRLSVYPTLPSVWRKAPVDQVSLPQTNEETHP